MMTRMRPIELAVIALCVVASTFAAPWKATRHEVDQFSKATETRRFELTVPHDSSHGRVQIDAKIREGTMRWTVLDPSGKDCWSGSTGKGSDITLSRSFDVAPGEWTLVLELRDAAGSYDVKWSAS